MAEGDPEKEGFVDPGEGEVVEACRKRDRVEEEVVVEEGETEQAAEEPEQVAEEPEQVAEEPKQSAEEPEPKRQKVEDAVTVGPLTFSGATEACSYFSDLLSHFRPEQDLNEYEFVVLLELLTKGHRDPQKKIGVGVSSFQIRTHPTYGSKCFYICRTDGTSEDFSFRKCVARLFPNDPLPRGRTTAKAQGNQGGAHVSNGGGRGSQRGSGGRRGRGRGGRRGRGRGGGRRGR